MRTDAPLCESNTAEWEAMRRTGFGASEAAMSVDRSKYATRFELYHRKLGNMPALDLGLPGKVGHLAEPLSRYLFEHYSEELTGRREVINRYPLGLYRSKRFPWMLASPDAATESNCVVQLKATAPEVIWSWKKTDELPDDWFLQAQQEMEVMECDKAFFGVFVTTIDFRIFTVERNEKLIKILAAAQKDLMERLRDGREPEPNFKHASTYDAIRTVLRDVEKGKTAELDADAMKLRDRREELAVLRKELDAEDEACKARLMYLAQDAEKILFPDGTGMTRVTVGPSRVEAYDKAGYSYFRSTGKKKKAS